MGHVNLLAGVLVHAHVIAIVSGNSIGMIYFPMMKTLLVISHSIFVWSDKFFNGGNLFTTPFH